MPFKRCSIRSSESFVGCDVAYLPSSRVKRSLTVRNLLSAWPSCQLTERWIAVPTTLFVAAIQLSDAELAYSHPASPPDMR